jgi:hypothetical protein
MQAIKAIFVFFARLQRVLPRCPGARSNTVLRDVCTSRPVDSRLHDLDPRKVIGNSSEQNWGSMSKFSCMSCGTDRGGSQNTLSDI